ACYQKLSVHCIQEKFPQFDFEKCKQLLIESRNYYSTHILLDFFSSILEKVENFVKLTSEHKTVSIDEFMLFLDEAGKISDFNERLKTPSILNFEYRSRRYRLRKEQVKDIEDLTTIDESTGLFKSSVIQRMMAAGKTLVLGTISVVKKALDKKKLSILVPPSSLYQSNLSAMQARTYSFFKAQGHNFIFPRLTFGDDNFQKTVIPFLELILENIERVRQRSDYFVLSPESLQSFLNSYIELLNYHGAIYNRIKKVDENSLEALKLYAKLYNIFRKESSIILDEIDMTMDPKKELNFPTIEKEPYNMTAVALMTDLIEFSVFDEDVRKVGLDIHGNNQSGLTVEGYKEYVKVLLEYIKKQLGEKRSLWSINFAGIDDSDIMAFLSNPEMDHMKGWINSLHEDSKGTLADALIIVKAQITKKLQESFKGTTNLNFGLAGSLRPQTEYAIPYLAANTPSPSSEFADRWETLVKTLLTLASVECTESLAKNMINQLKK
ncbi:MAG: hypothetical protein EBU93_06325, partial [Chlamydiae bacterium]|nr:hypothetical protein [Chlamydiota bacterium]